MMTWNFSSVPQDQRAGLLWLVIGLSIHVSIVALGVHLGSSESFFAVSGLTLLFTLVGLVRWVQSRRVARKVLEVHEAKEQTGVALFQGVLRSRDPLLRVEVGGRLLKVRTPKTTLARQDARPLTPLERVSVLGWDVHVEGINSNASTIELDRALVHPGDVESLRQRILQHGDFYAIRWVIASLTCLLVGIGIVIYF